MPFFPLKGNPICLSALLDGKKIVDIRILCGRKELLPVRLIAIKLNEDQTAERIRKAKKDRDKRLNHSNDYYFLLGYVIFITNVDEYIWQATEAAQAYRCRWNIEILFKSWKSGLKAGRHIPDARGCTQRVESYLYMMLLYLTWFHRLVFTPLRWAVFKETGRHLSIIKAALWAVNNMGWFFEGCSQKIIREIKYFCIYDSRKDRHNAMQKLEAFLEHSLA